MAFTRKHSFDLALALADQRPHVSDACYGQWLLDIDAVATVAEGFNQRFDREQFIGACLAPVTREEYMR